MLNKEKLKKLGYRIDAYIKWDYGFSPIETYKKFKSSKTINISNKVLHFFLGILVLIGGFGVGGILSLLYFAYPGCVAILLLLDLMAVIIVYYEYNGYMEGVKQCITDIIKNVRPKKTKN